MAEIMKMWTTACLLLVIGNAFALEDPTRPWPSSVTVMPKTTPPETLTVHAIVYSPERKNATLNGKLLHIGDSIDGYRLTEIHALHVVVVKDRKQKVLKIFGK